MTKLNFSIILLLGLFLVENVRSQASEKEAIAHAIQKGNAKAVGAYFATSVDLTLDDLEDVYSKDQAIVILENFFSENPPSAFSLKHEGKSKLEDHFYIGDLKTPDQGYRLTFFLKKEGDAFKLKQLRIER